MTTRALSVFGPFRLDAANAQLWRGDEEISLRRKTFDVLCYLVEHPGELVTKAALLDAVWAEVNVSDSMPATCVAELRKLLGDEARSPQFIETVHRRGYRFIAKVTTAAQDLEPKRPVAATGPAPIMVGREKDLAQLQDWYSQVLQGQRRVVFIVGEAGIGKTTLVRAFLNSIAQQGTVRVAHGQCVEQYGAGEPYMPVLEALSRLGQEPGGARVIELLNRFAPTWLAQMPALQTPEEHARMQSQHHVPPQRMLREMTEALEALAADAPLVLSLEDLHWSDFSTLELISAVARRGEPARLLVIGTYRLVDALASEHPLRAMRQELGLHRYCEELSPRLLNEKDVAGYLERRFSGSDSQGFGSLASAIHERADGNPLFMISVVDYLVDAGFLSSTGQAYAAAAALQSDTLGAPRSIREMIERNLERLKPEEQAVLEGASVAGAEFSAAAVAAALERPQAEVEACCTRLSRHQQFVTGHSPVEWPDATVAAGFRFHHALYQEVLYGLLPPGRRVHLHRLIAAREETAYGERANEIASELAHHYSRANDRPKAIQYFRVAGGRAEARGAAVEAERDYRHAIQLMKELPESAARDQVEFEVQIALGRVLRSSRSWSHPETKHAFARAEELAKKLGEPIQLMLVLLGQKSAADGSGQFRLARELGELLLAAAERSGDRAAVCGAHARLGNTLTSLAQYVPARKHLELADSNYEEDSRGEFAFMGTDAVALAAIPSLLLGFPDRARQLLKNGVRRAERRQHPFFLGLAHMWGGMVSRFLDDADGALHHAQALNRLAEQQPVFQCMADQNLGRALMLQGRWEEGVTYSRRAIPLHQTSGLLAQLPWAKLDVAAFFASQNKTDEALALVAEVLADWEENALLRPPALRQRAGLIALRSADASAIDEAYRTAIESAHSQGARFFELQAAIPFARWLKSQGRIVEARKLLAGVYGWFTEGFDTVLLKEAKALLDELNKRGGVIVQSNRSRKPAT